MEGVARLLYVESATSTLPCLILNDPTKAVRAVPNSLCLQKAFESHLSTYSFNSCGHRAGIECGLKPKDTYRIVLVGSSFGYGMFVDQKQTFASLIPPVLSRRSGLNVQVYNEAMQWGIPLSVALRFKEVLDAQPDMVLWALTPFDIENVDSTTPYIPPEANRKDAKSSATIAPQSTLKNVWARIKIAMAKKSPSEFVHDAWLRVLASIDDTRTVFMLRHIIYQSQSEYLTHYLMQGESANFLRVEPGVDWQRNLDHFEKYASEVEALTKSAGARLVVTLIPQRAQSAMISLGDWPHGFDPYRVGSDVKRISEQQGATYVDVLGRFRKIPNPERYYFPVDGHLNESGHRLVAGLLVDALLPALPRTANATIPANP